MPDALPEKLQALVGERIHVLDDGGIVLTISDHDSGSLYPRTVLYPRGASVILSEAMVWGTVDRAGNSWLLAADLSDSAPRWGFGAFPDTEDVFIRGSQAALDEGDRRRAIAWRTLTGADLRRTLTDLDARFGRNGQRSQILTEDPRTADKQAQDQAAQREFARLQLQQQAQAAREFSQTANFPPSAA